MECNKKKSEILLRTSESEA